MARTEGKVVHIRGPFVFTRLDMLFCAIVTLALGAAICVGAGAFSWSAIAVIFVMSYVSLATGRALLPHGIAVFRCAGAFVLGSLFLSLLMFIISRVFIISAGPAFILACVIGLAIAAGRRRHGMAQTTSATDLASLTIAAAAAFIWSWQAVNAVPRLLTTRHFNAWADYFLHAGEITQFSDFASLRGRSIFAAGAPLPPYHYGGYMLSAALSGITGIPALTTATTFWTPFGFLLLGLGVCGLGGILAGETGGVIALAAVLLIPSASHYGLKNPFFDFHWLLQISSSGCYGLAAACLAVGALVLWLRDRRPAALAWAVALTLATFAFRVHVFLPLAIANGASWICGWRPRAAWHRAAVIAAGVLTVILALLALEHIQRAPHLLTGEHHPVRLLLIMLGMTGSPHANAFQLVANQLGSGGGLIHDIGALSVLLVGIIMLAVAAFGVWLPLYLVGLSWRRGAGIRLLEDFIPLAALAAYIAVLLIFPSNSPEQLEFAHRPFVFVYVMLAIWCAKFAAAFLQRFATPLWATTTLAALLLATPVALQSKAQISALDWGNQYCGLAIPRGLIDAATYVRNHAAPGEMIANTPAPLDDAFIALSQRPELAPGTPFLAIQSGLPAAALIARENRLNQILTTPSSPSGPAINWVVTFPPATPGPNPAFSELGFTVHHAIHNAGPTN